jgi:GNAT superfamily N-acetyltransferase
MAGDAQPDSGSFAAFDPSGTVIGCVTVHREPPPDAIPQVGTGGSWRLRGMATADGHRRQGIGAALLTSAVAHVAAQGGTLLWCNARMPAVPFYRKGGFETAGQPWEVPELGPHIVMWRGVPPLP